MIRLTRLAALAAFCAGCICAKKDATGPVPRPPRVHAWASLANLDKSVDNTSALLAKFGVPVNKDALREGLVRESGLSAAVIGEIDFSRAVWTAGVAAQGAGSYQYVYAVPVRDEQRFLGALRKEMDESKVEGALKFTPKAGVSGLREPMFATVTQRYAVVCPQLAPLLLARDFLLRTLVPSPGKGDLHILLTHDFMAGWQKLIGDLSELQVPAVAGVVRRLVERAVSVEELSLSAEISPTEVVLGIHVSAADGGPMHAVLKRQIPGPAYGAEWMPAETWLYYTDRYSAASLAETTLDLKHVLAALSGPRREELDKAAASLAGAMTGEVAVGASGAAIVVAAHVRDATVARAALDTLVGAIARSEQVRREGSLAVIDLPLPGGFVPPLITGRPAVASLVEGERLLLSVGIGAEARLRELMDGAGATRLDKSGGFTKTVSPQRGRIGLVYLSVAQLLRAMLQAVPGAPAPASAPETPGVLLDWVVNDARTAADLRLRFPADAFATLGPLLQSLPFMGGGPAMPGAPWKPSP